MAKAIPITTGRISRREVPTEEVLNSRFDPEGGRVVAAAATPNLPLPFGDLSRATVEDLVATVKDLVPHLSSSTLVKYRRSVRLIADHLAAFPGETWQDRWLVSGLDNEEEPRPIRTVEHLKVPSGTMVQGMTLLTTLRVIQPSLAALRWNELPNFADVFLAGQRDPAIDACFAAIEEVKYSGLHRRRARYDLAAVLATQRIPLADLTPSALLHYAWEWRRVCAVAYDQSRFGARVLWEVLHTAGHFPPKTPAKLRQALHGGRRDVAELMDRYELKDQGIRQLLIDYLRVRQAGGMDYSSINGLSTLLGRNFWQIVENINPAQTDLRLDQQTYQAWIERLSVLDDGRRRLDIDAVLLAVRAFYFDLASWAVSEPERWAHWVAPNPIPASATRGYATRQRRRKERIADRTRQLQPLLPKLVDHVDARLAASRRLLAAVTAARPDDIFECNGQTYRRDWTRRDDDHLRWDGKERLRVEDVATGKRINVELAEDEDFWTWAILHTLRLTGVRVEELMELTHLSVRQYQRPNGEVIGLLVIAPSKTDRERVVPMSAELFHVIAEIVRRHTRDGKPIRLTPRWDHYEKVLSDPLPHLFQRETNSANGCISMATVTRLLKAACVEASATDPTFADVKFTPHDFRRLFATELVNSGVPIHIGAALLGHLSIQTTRGYVAVFDEDVVRHYQQFLDNRRTLRPAEEYRAVSPDEWDSFEEHFDTRKVELGTCGRPYGSACAHEHACLRCPVLRINPEMIGRLDEIEQDLVDRRERATREGWRGEIEGITLTLSLLDQKREEARRLAGLPGTVDLGMPKFTPSA